MDGECQVKARRPRRHQKGKPCLIRGAREGFVEVLGRELCFAGQVLESKKEGSIGFTSWENHD